VFLELVNLGLRHLDRILQHISEDSLMA
jgi:hypothetical protein